MKHRYFVMAWLLGRSAAAWGEGAAVSTPTIEGLDYRGSGCREGTVVSNMSPDGQAFTLIFSDYTVDSSVHSGRARRRSCDLVLKVAVPQNKSFAVFSFQVRGFAALEPGAIGVIHTRTSLSGGGREVGRLRLEGPFNDDFTVQSAQSLHQVEWSPCGRERTRKLRLSTATVVRPKMDFGDDDGERDDARRGGGYPAGTISFDSIDGGVVQRYGLVWRACSAGHEGRG